MTANLDDLLLALYVLADDLLPKRDPSRPGRKPKISDAEVICLAVAQILLDCPKERRFLRLARGRLGHLFDYIPGQSGFNKRVRAVARDGQALGVRRLRRLGYCAAHSRHLFLGLQALPLGGLRRDADLLRAGAGERSRARGRRSDARAVELCGYTVIGDKGLSGAEIEQLVAALGGLFLRPDRRDEKRRFGNLGGVRQWIEAIFDQLKDQLSLERHGAHTMEGLCTRVAQRMLALGACVWHNWRLWDAGELDGPIRSLVAYDH